VVPEMVSKNVRICNQINTGERVCPVPAWPTYRSREQADATRSKSPQKRLGEFAGMGIK
jgi:hypothetical protein